MVGGAPGGMPPGMITQTQYRHIRNRHHEVGGNITMTARKTDHSRGMGTAPKRARLRFDFVI